VVRRTAEHWNFRMKHVAVKSLLYWMERTNTLAPKGMSAEEAYIIKKFREMRDSSDGFY